MAEGAERGRSSVQIEEEIAAAEAELQQLEVDDTVQARDQIPGVRARIERLLNEWQAARDNEAADAEARKRAAEDARERERQRAAEAERRRNMGSDPGDYTQPGQVAEEAQAAAEAIESPFATTEQRQAAAKGQRRGQFEVGTDEVGNPADFIRVPGLPPDQFVNWRTGEIYKALVDEADQASGRFLRIGNIADAKYPDIYRAMGARVAELTRLGFFRPAEPLVVDENQRFKQAPGLGERIDARINELLDINRDSRRSDAQQGRRLADAKGMMAGQLLLENPDLVNALLEEYLLTPWSQYDIKKSRERFLRMAIVGTTLFVAGAVAGGYLGPLAAQAAGGAGTVAGAAAGSGVAAASAASSAVLQQLATNGHIDWEQVAIAAAMAGGTSAAGAALGQALPSLGLSTGFTNTATGLARVGNTLANMAEQGLERSSQRRAGIANLNAKIDEKRDEFRQQQKLQELVAERRRQLEAELKRRRAEFESAKSNAERRRAQALAERATRLAELQTQRDRRLAQLKEENAKRGAAAGQALERLTASRATMPTRPAPLVVRRPAARVARPSDPFAPSQQHPGGRPSDPFLPSQGASEIRDFAISRLGVPAAQPARRAPTARHPLSLAALQALTARRRRA